MANQGKIIKFYIEPNKLEKWMHQNKANFTGTAIEGCLLDNFVIDTEKGFAMVYESYVNPNQSRYYVEYAISREKNEKGNYKHCIAWKIVWKNWYKFAAKYEEV